MKKVFTYVFIALACVLTYSQVRSCSSPTKEISKYTTKVVVDSVESEKIKVVIGETEGEKITIDEYIPPESPLVIYVDRGVSDEEYYSVVAQLDSLIGASSDTVFITQAKLLLGRLDNVWQNGYIRTSYEYKKSGFCFAPNIGLPFDLLADDSSTVSGVSLGSRLAYYDRFGVGLNGSLYLNDSLDFDRAAINLFVDGRLPYADNVGAGIFGGYSTKSQWGCGVLFNFYIND